MMSMMSAEQFVADRQRERRAAAEAYRAARLVRVATETTPERRRAPARRRPERAAAWAA
jgi:hypothetical protein